MTIRNGRPEQTPVPTVTCPNCRATVPAIAACPSCGHNLSLNRKGTTR